MDLNLDRMLKEVKVLLMLPMCAAQRHLHPLNLSTENIVSHSCLTRQHASTLSPLPCSAHYRVGQWLREPWPHSRPARSGMLDRVRQPYEVVDAQQRPILSERSAVRGKGGGLVWAGGRYSSIHRITLYRRKLAFNDARRC